ncbi:MAG: Ig-like domain-containing protein [Bacteroidales bacterium]|nr:Ig-like domain-containing protein [Bacteroidales bacterium]
MKRNLILGLMVALAVSGCNVPEIGEVVSADKVFTATTESYVADGVETKTSMDAEGNVLWKRGDQVSIFAGSTLNEHYQVTDASDGKTAAAMNKVESTGSVAGSEIANNVAFYPYAEAAEILKRGNSYVIKGIELPTTQRYARASFGNGAFPMAAVTTSTGDYNLKFKNVLGGLKLQLTGTARIVSISVTGNNGESLCGSADVLASVGDAPSLHLTDGGETTVTLSCGNGVRLTETAATAFIIALPPMTMEGGFTVLVSDTDGKQMEIKTTKSQTITRSNLLAMPAINYVGAEVTQGPEAVDLGLPSGLKWASCNVGATAPEEIGDYFAWGETEPYYSSLSPLTWKDGKSAGYDWDSYRWCRSSANMLNKYNVNSEYGTLVDNKITLELADDAAHANWGGSWRIPSCDDWDELLEKCTWTWTTRNGIDGYLVTGPNGNSIFMPVTGLRYETNIDLFGLIGYYLTSSIMIENPSAAYCVSFDLDHVYRYSSDRCDGVSVRPVSDEGVRVSVTDISLDKTSLTLAVGEAEMINAIVTPTNATQKDVIWSSSRDAFASVSWDGVVTAERIGTTTITATTYDGNLVATCVVTVCDGKSNGQYYVDLGLTSGLKWATCNVGAINPEEYGDYFAWGDTEPYYSSLNPVVWKDGKSAGYDWPSYKLCNGSYNSFTKYNYLSPYGIIDNKTILDTEDDAAHANWGGSWRMPTDDEWTELRTECTWIWSEHNGVNGYVVIGPNSKTIFLPAAGSWYLEDYTGSRGDYWSSSLGMSYPFLSMLVSFTSDSFYRNDFARSNGQSVRPVFSE